MRKLLSIFLLLILSASFIYAQETPGTGRFPTALDTTGSLFNTKDNAISTLSSSITNSSSSITVADGSKFPASSFSITIDSEVIYATTRSGNSITGLTRGAGGTTAASHTSGAIVRSPPLAAHHNILAAQLVATQAKIGYTASTPISGAVLAGTGAGTSAWQTLSTLGIVTASGASANAYALFNGATTLQNGFWKQETGAGAVTVDGAGSAPEIRLMTNGTAGVTNYTMGVLYADANAVKITARSGGTFSSQATSIQIQPLNNGIIQFMASNGVPQWSIGLGGGLRPNATTQPLGDSTHTVNGLYVTSTTGVLYYNSGAAQIGLISSVLNTLTLTDSTGTAGGKFEFATGVYLTSGSGSPEGVVTANKGSLYSDTTNGDLYVKHSTTGNTGWVLK
jgi:hypothetical protein